MAADFTSDTAVETEAQADEFDAADDTVSAFAGDEETPFVDDQTAAEDESLQQQKQATNMSMQV